MAELDPKTHEQIKTYCERGDSLVELEEYEDAIDQYEKAFDLIPEPKTDWDTATWVLTALGETRVFMEDWQNALAVLQQAMHCPDAIGNPFLHFLLGKTQFELGNMDRAADELTRAYMGSGMDLLGDEDEDPKYLAFLRTKIKIAE